MKSTLAKLFACLYFGAIAAFIAWCAVSAAQRGGTADIAFSVLLLVLAGACVKWLVDTLAAIEAKRLRDAG